MRATILAAIGSAAFACGPAAAASPLDGSWATIVQCPREPLGGEGYIWRFVSQVRDGRLHGQYGIPGQSPSASFDGPIDANGAGTLTVSGFSGSAQYNIGNARGGSPIRYVASVRLAGRTGSGERVDGRTCTLTFSKR